MEEVRYTKTRPRIKLTRGKDKFWRDEFGTIHAIPDPTLSADKEVRCGVGPLSLDIDPDACRTHDYMYESPVYQEFHTRKEADDLLHSHLRLLKVSKRIAWSMWAAARQFGIHFWDNIKTK